MRDTTKGAAMVALATVGWSLSGLFVRAVPRLDAWTINAYRGLNMALVLMLWLLLRHRKQAWQVMRTPERMALFWFAAFFSIGTSMYIWALQLASVAAVASLGATSALFAAVVGRFWLGERTSGLFWVAIVVAMGGVVLIATGESGTSQTGLLGTLVALGVAAAFAIQSAALRRHRDVPMEPAYIYGGLAVYAVMQLTFGVQALTGQEYLLLLGMGTFQLAIPGLFFIRGARHVSAVQMVLISMMDTFLNPFWAWLVFGEMPPSNVYAGGALILTAILGTTLWDLREARRAGVTG
jgi:drug/metabolite transporter, DME family